MSFFSMFGENPLASFNNSTTSAFPSLQSTIRANLSSSNTTSQSMLNGTIRSILIYKSLTPFWSTIIKTRTLATTLVRIC